MKTRRLRLKSLKRSHNPAKKWDATFEYPDGHTKTTSFGARGMSDFTKHKDVTRRNRYLQRHGRMNGGHDNWHYCRPITSLCSAPPCFSACTPIGMRFLPGRMPSKSVG